MHASECSRAGFFLRKQEINGLHAIGEEEGQHIDMTISYIHALHRYIQTVFISELNLSPMIPKPVAEMNFSKLKWEAHFTYTKRLLSACLRSMRSQECPFPVFLDKPPLKT